MDICLIQTEKLKELAKKAFLYDYLNNGGADNWEWYNEAISEGILQDAEYYEIKLEKPKVENIVEVWLEKEYPVYNLEEEIAKCTKEYLQQS